MRNGFVEQLRRYRHVLSGIIILTLTMASINAGKGDDINPGLYSTDSTPYGISYQEWTQRLWQWDLSLPPAQHPLHNYTPENCANGQDGPVWFLAEVLSGTEERTCTIPAGKSILAALLDGECDSSDPTLQNDQDVRQCATEGNDYGVISATLDGRRMQNLDQYRIDSGFYNITISGDNIADEKPGTYRAFTNGFFVFLQPLQNGTHDLRLTVSVTNPVKPQYNYAADWTYHLLVSEEGAVPEFPLSFIVMAISLFSVIAIFQIARIRKTLWSSRA